MGCLNLVDHNQRNYTLIKDIIQRNLFSFGNVLRKFQELPKFCGRKQVVLDRFTADQVFLNDAFNNFGSTGVIPCTIRVNQHDGPFFAYTQAINLAAVDAAFTGQIEFVKPFLKVIPGCQSVLFAAALRVGLVTADEDVIFHSLVKTQVRRNRGKFPRNRIFGLFTHIVEDYIFNRHSKIKNRK